jgi:hypothetical protein
VQLTETDRLVEAKRAAKWEQRDAAEGPSPETGAADNPEGNPVRH